MSQFEAHATQMVLPWSFILVIFAVGIVTTIISQNVLGGLMNKWNQRAGGHHKKKSKHGKKKRNDSDSDDSDSDSD